MTTKLTKTTKTNTTVNWSAALLDSDGTQFAAMSATMDAARPLGSVSLTVHNQARFEAHKAEATAAYNDFVAQVAALAATTELSITDTQESEEVAEV